MEGETLFSKIFESAPIMMVVVDGERRIHRANKAALDFMARPHREILELKIGSAFGCLNSLENEKGCGFGHHCTNCMVRNSVIETLRTGESRYRVDALVPIAAGDREIMLSLLVSTTLVLLPGGRFALVCLENMTDFKNSERALKQYTDHLKLLSSIMRHDIRNSFMVLNASLMLAKEKIGSNVDEQTAKVIESAFEMINKSDLLLKRISELEQVAPAESGLEAVDLKRVAEEIAGKYPIEIRIHGSGTALADGAINSVIDNIVSNAVEHSGTDRIDIAIEASGDHCRLRIADYGIGIPDENKEKVFEKGFTFGGKGHTGLGLYIAKTIVERYGGRIQIEDNKPRGAAFLIELQTPRRRASDS